MADGSIFKFDEIKNNAERETQRGVPKRSLANATSPASNNSLPHPSEKINISDENSSEIPKIAINSHLRKIRHKICGNVDTEVA